MKQIFFILLIFVFASCGTAPVGQTEATTPPAAFPKARVVPTPPAAPEQKNYKFIILAWDANPENDIQGYRLYMGVESGHYLGSLPLDLERHLHGICEVPFLINHPITALAVSAYNTTGLEGPLSDELIYEYPPAAPTLP